MICLFAKLQKWWDSRTPQVAIYGSVVYCRYFTFDYHILELCCLSSKVENNDATQEPETAPQYYVIILYNYIFLLHQGFLGLDVSRNGGK